MPSTKEGLSMGATGSRSNSRALRFALTGFVAAFAVGLLALHAHNAHAVTPTVVTVNSTANTDDGICSGPPNAGTGNCTLREAIYAVNAGQADTIKFHPTIFSKTTPGVINLESGFGDLPTIVREVTIDGTGAGVIIDGNVNGDATVCSAAGLLAGLDAHGNPALACDNGIEVSAPHNNFAFSLLGNGTSFFVIQHICSPGDTGCGTPRASGQNGSGQGVWLCGGDTSVTSGLDCTDFSFGTVRVDGVDIRDTEAAALDMEGTNLVDAKVTNSSLSGTGPAVVSGGGYAVFVSVDASDGDAAPPERAPCDFNNALNCLTANSVTLDHNILNSLNSDAVDMTFNGNLDSHSSINAIVTNNTFTSDHTAVDISTNATFSEQSTYNIDINHNSDMHSATSSAVVVGEFVSTLASHVTSTINISDNGNISGGIVSTAGAGQAAGSDRCDLDAPVRSQPSTCSISAIDVVVFYQSGNSHSSSDLTIDRNGNITGSGSGVRVLNSVCCGSGNHAGTEISDNTNIKGLSGDGVDVTNNALDDGSIAPFIGDNGSSQVTIHHNHSITGGGSEGVYVSAAVGATGGNGDENISDVAVTDNGPIRSSGDGDAVEVLNFASSSGGVGDDNTAATHVTGNGPITSASGDGVDVDNRAGDTNGGFEGNGNTATVDVSHNGDITGNDIGILNFNLAGSSRTGPGDNNTAGTTIQSNGLITGTTSAGIADDTEAGTDDSGPGNHNSASSEVSGNGNLTGGGGDGITSDVFAGGNTAAADSNTATNKVHDNGTIQGAHGIYLETIAGDGQQTASGDHNTIDTEVVHNGAITGVDGDGVAVEMFAGGATVDSLDNHTTTKVNQNGAIVGETSNGIRLFGESAGDGAPPPAATAWVCCDAADTNMVEIVGNTGGILGQTNDGILIDGICCSVNTVTIKDNAGTITGLQGSGIEYRVDGAFSTPGCACFVDVDANGFPDAIEHSVNDLIVSGNDISNSSGHGLYILAGAFDASMVNVAGVGKSIISGNTINGNGQNGFWINTVQGLNIGPNNTISGNGFASDNNVHAGIQITNDLADSWLPAAVYLPAGGNHISQNSIYNNHNAFTDVLGIDLSPENAGTGTDGLRIGCRTKGNPIDPNNCIQAPVINLVAEGGIVGGTTCALCTVEVFVADPNPHDQPLTVAAIQHGEGKTYLASGTADSSGNYQVHLPCGLAAGDLTATATNKVKDTSEFSENHPFLGTGVCATATSTASNTPVPPTATNTVVPPTPTLTPVPKACGDVNDDGHVNAVDAQLILQLSAGLITTLPNMPSADVNHSGGVNPVDAALILQVEAGLIPQSSLHCT
jgi:CSLREA domain-containing protein